MSLFAFSRRVLYFIAFKSGSHCRGNRWCSNSTNFKTSCFQYIQRVCHELILAYSVYLVYRNCGYNSATVYIKSDALLQQLKKVICQGGLVAHISFTAWKIAEYKFVFCIQCFPQPFLLKDWCYRFFHYLHFLCMSTLPIWLYSIKCLRLL